MIGFMHKRKNVQKNLTLKRMKCKRILKKKPPGLEKKTIPAYLIYINFPQTIIPDAAAGQAIRPGSN